MYTSHVAVDCACEVASVGSDCATLEAAAHQASPSMEFSRSEYWSGLPFPSGGLPDTGIEAGSLTLAGKLFTTSDTWETLEYDVHLDCFK